jgi:hypothetical protein
MPPSSCRASESVFCTDLEHLSRYVSGTLGAIEAVRADVTSLLFERVKEASTVRRGTLLASPRKLISHR